MASDHLILERDAGAGTVTPNRLAVLNALDIATLRDLDLVRIEPRVCAPARAVVLTGAGEKACAETRKAAFTGR